MSDAAAKTMEEPEAQQAGRIEGGIDAIVIGAGAEGLTAAAYLGKAGLHTVLVGAGAEIGGRVAEREIAPGVSGVDGEHLVTLLDPDVIAELDLYRHGLEFAARRLDTTYFFDEEDALKFDGDLSQAAQVSLDDEEERDALEAFMSEMLELAAFLRPAFKPAVYSSGGHARKLVEKTLSGASPQRAAQIRKYLFASVRDVLSERFADGPLKTLLYGEAAFRSGASPHEPFSFMPFLRRLAGEAAGLQGATAYPAGGAVSVIAALRRAAQGAKVDVRAATPVKSILIEGDRVAGVVLSDGGQLRAPLVVAAGDAQVVFLNMIGPEKIDIELQRILTAQRPELATARLHLILKGVARDEGTQANMRRRLFFAPSVEDVTAAFIDARAGRVPGAMIVEAIFPHALDDAVALDGRQLMSVMAHPLPFEENPDNARREEIKTAALSSLEMFANGLSKRVELADLRLPCDEAAALGAAASPFAAKPDMMRQWALSAATAASGKIGGLYFCGPEAQIGAGLSCSAARSAARAALRAYRKGLA